MSADEDNPETGARSVSASDQAQYTASELHGIRADFASGKTPGCPRCRATMTRREIGGGSFGLGYARQRDWLICPQCRRSAIFDIHRGTRT